MHRVEILTGLLILIVIIALVASRLRIAYPIAFVIGGALVAFLPNVPSPEIAPEIVFFVFLPPLLFTAAWLIPWQGFLQSLRSISLLAVVPVVATTAAVGFIMHWVNPSLPLAAAFVLGAIVSPPDAVAATAVTSRLGLPRRISVVLEGESLLNDATGLTLVYFTQLAVITGSFSFAAMGETFLYVAFVGVLAGGLVGAVMTAALRYIQDNAVTMTLFLITPYCAYLLGETVESSGVLATVTAGLILARYSSDVLSSSVRLEVRSTLNTQVFILNGLVFVLVGSQLPVIMEGIRQQPTFHAIWHTAVLVLVVMGVRFLMIFPLLYLPPLLVPPIRRREGWPDWRHSAVISWTGMRGVVSMAAALSIPLTISSGEPFPGRDTIIFCTFGVILVTLLVQGLSLPGIIHAMKLGSDQGEDLLLAEVRLRLAKAGIHRIIQQIEHEPTPPEVEKQLRMVLDQRVNYLQEQYDILSSGGTPTSKQEAAKPWHAYHNLLVVGITAERAELLRLNRSGEIDDNLRRRFDYELDLEAVRLSGSRFA